MQPAGDSSYASTAQVAQALGVSVSTVKRWVDDGVLPAHKTAGGHRKLLVADVLELARRSDLPHANLSKLVDRRRGSKPPKADELADELRHALLAGDADRVRLVILGNCRRGLSIADLADGAIGPAMAAIGREWQTGRIDVMEEHRASQLCASALYEWKATLEEQIGKSAPRAVGAAPEDDYSTLPTLLAQMTLLEVGWDAINLGPDTPFKSLVRAIDELHPCLMWLSASHLGDEDTFLAGYRDFHRHAEKAGVAVAIGGRALTQDVWSRLPYATHGDTLNHLADFARTLHPRPSRPRRGRPKSK